MDTSKASIVWRTTDEGFAVDIAAVKALPENLPNSATMNTLDDVCTDLNLPQPSSVNEWMNLVTRSSDMCSQGKKVFPSLKNEEHCVGLAKGILYERSDGERVMLAAYFNAIRQFPNHRPKDIFSLAYSALAPDNSRFVFFINTQVTHLDTTVNFRMNRYTIPDPNVIPRRLRVIEPLRLINKPL